MAKETTVVVAHYDPDALGRLRDELEAEGLRVRTTTSGRDAIARARESGVDALVVEPLLAKTNGIEVLRHLKESEPPFAGPVLVLIDDGDTYTENRALLCGADGIVKRDPEGRAPRGALAAKLRSLLSESRLVGDSDDDVDELRRILDDANDKVRNENPVLAHITDSLTGLFNRAYLDLKLAEEFKRSRRFGIPIALIEMELTAGDTDTSDDDDDWSRVLNEAAGILLCESRDIDILARTGSRSFALLLAHTPVEGAKTMISRVLDNFRARQLSFGESQTPLRALAGIAPYEGDSLEGWEELAKRGEEALDTARLQNAEEAVIWSPKRTDLSPDGGGTSS